MYDCLVHAIEEDTKSFSVDLVPNSAQSYSPQYL